MPHVHRMRPTPPPCLVQPSVRLANPQSRNSASIPECYRYDFPVPCYICKTTRTPVGGLGRTEAGRVCRVVPEVGPGVGSCVILDRALDARLEPTDDLTGAEVDLLEG